MKHPFSYDVDANGFVELDQESIEAVSGASSGGEFTTLALGEEGGSGGVTTMAVGEEGGSRPPIYTTLAVGEEGGGYPSF